MAGFAAYKCATHKRLPPGCAWGNDLFRLRRPGRLKAANRCHPAVVDTSLDHAGLRGVSAWQFTQIIRTW